MRDYWSQQRCVIFWARLSWLSLLTLRKFFWIRTIFEVFIEVVTILLLLFIFCLFWPWVLWDLSSPTRDWTRTPCIGGWILNHWTTKEVPCENSGAVGTLPMLAHPTLEVACRLLPCAVNFLPWADDQCQWVNTPGATFDQWVVGTREKTFQCLGPTEGLGSMEAWVMPSLEPNCHHFLTGLISSQTNVQNQSPCFRLWGVGGTAN